MPNREWVIGDTGWILSQYNGVEEVLVLSDRIKDKDAKTPYYRVCGKAYGDETFQFEDMIFESQGEANRYIENYKNSKIDCYKERIKSKEDLLNFIVGFMYCNEYTNYEAIAAAKEKCLELFGIQIKES